LSTMRLMSLLCSFAFFAVVKAVPDVVRLGFVYPMFGPNFKSVQSNLQLLPAFLLAVQEINSRKDLLPNTEVLFASRNSRSTFLGSLDAALNMTTAAFNGKGISVAVGAKITSVTAAMQGVFASQDVCHVGYATGNDLTVPTSALTYIGLVPPDRTEGTVIAQLIGSSWLKLRRVVVFYSIDNLGIITHDAFAAQAKIAGLDIKGAFPFFSTATDFSSYIEAARVFDPYIVVVFATSANGAALLEQAYDLGLIREGITVFGSSFISAATTVASMSSPGKAAQVLKGFFGVQHIEGFWKSTPAGIDFLDKYVSYVGAHNRCNTSDVDDDGNGYLYMDHYLYNYSNQLSCALVNYTAISSNPQANVDSLVAYVYDAVYVMAVTLHHTLYVQNASLSGIAMKAYLTSGNFSFTGVTGSMDFAPIIPTLDAGGSRIKSQNFNVFNFQPSTGLFPSVGVYSIDTTAFKLCSAAAGCIAPTFNTAGNKYPTDAVEPEYITVDLVSRRALQAIAILLLLISVGVLGVVVSYRSHALIKAAQPVALYFILGGIIIGCFYVLLISFELDSNVCTAGDFLGHLSVVLVFGALAAKLWRLNAIVNRAGFSKVKITNTTVVIIIGVLFIPPLAILLASGGLNNKQIGYAITESIGGLKTYYPRCKDDYPGLIYLLFAYETLLILGSLLFAVLTRNAPVFLNESFSTFAVTASVAAAAAIVLALTVTDYLDPTADRVAVAIVFIVSIVVVLCGLFGDKLFNLLSEQLSKAGVSVRPSNAESSYASSNAVDLSGIPLVTQDTIDKVNGETLEKKLLFCEENIEKYRTIAMKICAEDAFDMHKKGRAKVGRMFSNKSSAKK
jgi:ABC-type branched-subunit amino acid transport system substrate-binding protein